MFGYFSVLLCFVFYIKIEKSEKYKNSVCFVYFGTCVPWMATETKFSKICISCNLDENLYAQLSKWALWLLFVMSKIKWSLVLNTRITTIARQSWNDTCMLQHSKSAVLMTFVCFSIAKLEFQKLNIIGYFFSLSYMPMYDLLK